MPDPAVPLAPPLDTDPTTKPWWKTSEAWAAVVIIVCGQLTAGGIIGPGTEAARIVGFIASTLVALGYGAARVTLKRAASAGVAVANTNRAAVAMHRMAGFARVGVLLGLAMVAAAAMLMFGCGGKVTGKTVGADAVDCALHPGSLAALAGAGDALLQGVTTPDGHVDTDALLAAAGALTVDVGGCVLTDAIARATAKRTSSQPSGGDTYAAELARAYERVRVEKFGGRTYKLAGAQ